MSRKGGILESANAAEKIGITRSVLSRYEAGITRLNDELVLRFALALRIPADELVGLSKNNPVADDPSNVRFIRRMQRIARLSPVDQKVILRTIDSFLAGVESENRKRHP